MRNLINFLVKYNYWFLFILLEVVSMGLLFRFNNYQQGAFFTSANVVAGKVYEVSSAVTSYFHLKDINEDLLERNSVLEQHISALERQLKDFHSDTIQVPVATSLPATHYSVFKAHIISNSINKADNYITLDKGSSDGILPDMGVVDGKGVVGIVYKTSSDYSVVISLLNRKSIIGCKITSSNYFGFLQWEGYDARYAYLKDLARHAEFNLGDTVVTSGHSSVFPEGVMIGTVDNMENSNDGFSYNLKIKLAADFGKLSGSGVRVLARTGQKEQVELEKSSMQE